MGNRSTQKMFLIAFSGLFLFLLPCAGQAEIPNKINYQGYLTSATGSPVNGIVTMVFSFYTVETGGSPIWTETRNVTVASGVYNVNLGDVNPITTSLPFGLPYYLGIAVGTDPEMTPRMPLTSVGYAFRAHFANYVYGTGTFVNPIVSTVTTGTAPLQVTSTTNVTNFNADMLDGQHAAAFAAVSHAHDDRYYDKAYVNALEARIAALEAKLTGLTRSGNDFVITNANLYIQSGSGTTNGPVNGKGNLIIGYNESRGAGDVRTGSHNLIVGPMHNYSDCGGIVGGWRNTVSGAYSSVLGGKDNTASGYSSSVSGGDYNTASGLSSTVSGGSSKTASTAYSLAGSPKPTYDSGWVAIAQDQYLTLTHGLGGNPDDFLVDLQFNDIEIRGKNQLFYGLVPLYADYELSYFGAFWSNLTDQSITIHRGGQDSNVDQVRVRIWKN